MKKYEKMYKDQVKVYVNEEKRIITVKFTTLLSHVGIIEAVGQARCSAEDEFNLVFGTKLATARAKRKAYTEIKGIISKELDVVSNAYFETLGMIDEIAFNIDTLVDSTK